LVIEIISIYICSFIGNNKGMPKYLTKAKKKVPKGDDTAVLVADMYGVSPRYVRMVICGDRINANILETYMQLKEGKSLLIEAVKQSVHMNF
jgi:hypothetical protein